MTTEDFMTKMEEEDLGYKGVEEAWKELENRERDDIASGANRPVEDWVQKLYNGQHPARTNLMAWFLLLSNEYVDDFNRVMYYLDVEQQIPQVYDALGIEREEESEGQTQNSSSASSSSANAGGGVDGRTLAEEAGMGEDFATAIGMAVATGRGNNEVTALWGRMPENEKQQYRNDNEWADILTRFNLV